MFRLRHSAETCQVASQLGILFVAWAAPLQLRISTTTTNIAVIVVVVVVVAHCYYPAQAAAASTLWLSISDWQYLRVSAWQALPSIAWSLWWLLLELKSLAISNWHSALLLKDTVQPLPELPLQSFICAQKIHSVDFSNPQVIRRNQTACEMMLLIEILVERSIVVARFSDRLRDRSILPKIGN